MPFPYSLPFPGSSSESTGFAQILDHADGAEARLLEQYRDKTNVVALVRLQGERTQEIEDTLWALYSERWLSTATGAQLDEIGAVVGQPRQSADDEIYRLYVQARIVLNRSSGTVEELIRLFQLVCPGGTVIQFKSMFPAGFRIELSSASFDDTTVAVLVSFMRAGRAAAVYGELLWLTASDAESFAFDGGVGLGFGSISDPSIGGKLAGIGV